jgi:hypothetical protein
MKVYHCTSAPSDGRFCYVNRHISPVGTRIVRGKEARPVLDRLGEDHIELSLNEGMGGLERPDLVGNNQNYLVLRRPCAEAILGGFVVGPHELFPTLLINRKKRVHADDYVLLNPLGQSDCLDRARSDMEESGVYVRMFGSFTLRAAAILADRDIFRVLGVPGGYMFSERLVEFIRARAFTNFVFEPVNLS